MRPVSGFERPIVQWLFVALSLILILVAAGAGWVARQAGATSATLQAEVEGVRIDHDRLEAQLARERSTREALALELERVRTGATAEPARVVPTLTLTPLKTRAAQPPAPTVAAPHATQIVELRLLLPPAADEDVSTFEVVMRDWSSGQLVWSRGGLTASPLDGQRAATSFITGDLLRAGAFELLLTGTSESGQQREIAAYELAVKK